MKTILIISAFYILLSETLSLVENQQEKKVSFTESVIFHDDLERNRIKPHSSKSTIIKQQFTRFEDGGYRFYYETSEGQSREEVGFFRFDPKLGNIFNVHGSYGYIGPSNKKVFVKYTSDERGFRYESSVYPPVGLPSASGFRTIDIKEKLKICLNKVNN